VGAPGKPVQFRRCPATVIRLRRKARSPDLARIKAFEDKALRSTAGPVAWLVLHPPALKAEGVSLPVSERQAHTLPVPAPAAPIVRAWRGVLAPLSIALTLLVGVAVVALLAGPTDIAPGTVARIVVARALHIDVGTWSATAEQIVWQIRVPRVLLAGLVGATLAVSGTAYQGVFRNPLAEPYLIGVAAGAGLGATIVLVSPVTAEWHGLTLVTPAAFAGAMLAVLLSYAVSRVSGVAGSGLILAGVAIGALCNATMSFLYMYNEVRITAVFNWLMGGFNLASWTRVGVLALYALPCLAVVWVHARLLNVLSLDEDQAQHLGVDVERLRLIVLGSASLATAAAVSFSGLIGFVGLIVPHVARLIVGPDVRRVLPIALVGGAALLIAADVIARTVLEPVELPVGIVTAFIGGPFFLLLLRRGRRAAW
jgi:iron complex transport system permease protein